MATTDKNTNRLEGAGGTFTINDALEHTLNFDTIQVDVKCKFDTLEINGVDVINDFIADNSSFTEPTIITCPYAKYSFTKIKLSTDGGQVTVTKI